MCHIQLYVFNVHIALTLSPWRKNEPITSIHRTQHCQILLFFPINETFVCRDSSREKQRLRYYFYCGKRKFCIEIGENWHNSIIIKAFSPRKTRFLAQYVHSFLKHPVESTIITNRHSIFTDYNQLLPDFKTLQKQPNNRNRCSIPLRCVELFPEWRTSSIFFSMLLHV